MPFRLIYWDEPTLALRNLPRAVPHLNVVRQDAESGVNWLWSHKGLVRLLPSETLANAIRLLDDYNTKGHRREAVPSEVGVLTWDQTLPLSDSAKQFVEAETGSPTPRYGSGQQNP